MTIEERDKLLEEVEMLKILLDFHVQNRQYILMSDHEFEEYANAVLDRLNELNDLLDFKIGANEKICSCARCSKPVDG